MDFVARGQHITVDVERIDVGRARTSDGDACLESGLVRVCHVAPVRAVLHNGPPMYVSRAVPRHVQGAAADDGVRRGLRRAAPRSFEDTV